MTPEEMLRQVLPPALEVLTAWSIAEAEDAPSVYHHAMERTLGDVAQADEPLHALAQMMFGLSSLSGILLDELASTSGRSHSEVLQALHHRYLNSAC